jgi:hypothetical protein
MAVEQQALAVGVASTRDLRGNILGAHGRDTGIASPHS